MDAGVVSVTVCLRVLQRVCRVHTANAAHGPASALGELPAITSLDSAAVLLDSQAADVKRVSHAEVICVCGMLPVFHLKHPNFCHKLIHGLLEKQAVLVCQLVFQEPLGQTVIRCAGAQRRTSSATRCLDHVTALQAFMVLSVSMVCSPLTRSHCEGGMTLMT